ncbi:MAG: hypothetical protein ACNA7Q_14590, partial [Rhodobacterales bacterium]
MKSADNSFDKHRAGLQIAHDRYNPFRRGPGFQPDHDCAHDNLRPILRTSFTKRGIVNWSNDPKREFRRIFRRRQHKPPGPRFQLIRPFPVPTTPATNRENLQCSLHG